jgi:methyl-accepting chemotaxis protein
VTVTRPQTISPKEHAMPEISTDITKAARDIANVAKDATYVVIGAGVLGFQQTQVQRRELMAKLQDPSSAISDRVTTARGDLNDAVKNVDAKVEEIMDRAEELIERVEAVFAPFEDRLPVQARDIAKQAHEQARDARTQIRNMRPTVGA